MENRMCVLAGQRMYKYLQTITGQILTRMFVSCAVQCLTPFLRPIAAVAMLCIWYVNTYICSAKCPQFHHCLIPPSGIAAIVPRHQQCM
jgi:hypothetical protein